MKKVNCIFATILLMFSMTAQSVVQCQRPVLKIWAGKDGNKIYVIHGDGFGNSGMKLESVDNDNEVINRALSIILAGHMADRKITFRYNAGASCTPSSSTTQQFIGAWVE